MTAIIQIKEQRIEGNTFFIQLVFLTERQKKSIEKKFPNPYHQKTEALFEYYFLKS